MSIVQVQNSFSASRLRACQKWPYTSSALLALVPVERPGMGTFGVDAYWRLYYDPAVLNDWTCPETAGVLLHEVCHVIRNHARRFANVLGFDPDKVLNDPSTSAETIINIMHLAKVWNIAADCEINDDLVEQKIPLPMPKNPEDRKYCPCLPSKFGMENGLLAEEYFSRLRNEMPAPKIKYVNGVPMPGSGSGASDDGRSLAAGVPGTQPSGSGADGCQRPWEEGKPDPNAKGKDGKSEQNPGINEGQAELIRHEVARRVQSTAKNAGSVPSGMRRWADQILVAKIDYKKELISQVKFAIEQIRGHSNQTYSRIARKQYEGGIIAAAQVCPNVSVSVIVDTSGSMSEGALGEALSELSGILKALPRQDGVRVYSCDAAVHNCKKVFRADQVELLGGGGTDMRGSIIAVSQAKPRPQLVICLTDGYTDYPDHPTNGVPCLAIIVSDGVTSSCPDWIRCIQLPSDFHENK